MNRVNDSVSEPLIEMQAGAFAIESVEVKCL